LTKKAIKDIARLFFFFHSLFLAYGLPPKAIAEIWWQNVVFTTVKQF